uniref:geranylgeranyl pyrophosphate synthase, chloroplastic/chromoplastic-like n=1 Tax=Erigeron canadensis TaxID=72917 RepID=UPI001CB98E73|nr:geranylgeranyl pyrophosphate synthase, chloroplastic/chromoplastic-like [Erigeron canadensis]
MPRLHLANISRIFNPTALLAYRKTTIVADVAQNLSYLDSIHSDIDSYLKKTITIREPLSVFEPMHHLTFATPKTTASALCVAACELVGGNREDAIVAASAIHLMHAAMYAHEHLLIKGRVGPKDIIPHQFGPNIELLIGDGILPFGFELLAGCNSASNNSEKILRVIIEITRAMGAEGMIDDNQEIDPLIRQPSRQLHGCGAKCGAILGGGNDEEIERLKRYGVCIGKIQRLLSEMEWNERIKVESIEKLKVLALQELENFDSKKVEQISSIIGV